MAEAQTTAKQRTELVRALVELGGGMFSPEDDIVQSGRQLVLPEGMTMSAAVKFLAERIAADEEAVDFGRTFPYRPWDGAVATWRGLKRVFGMVGLRGGWGAPDMVDVPSGPNGEHETVPWGVFSIPGLEGASIIPGDVRDAEHGPLFRLMVNAPRKHRAAVEGIFALVAEELAEHSIYRGKAFDGQTMPEFLDVTALDPASVVYAAETELQLDANVWSVLRFRAELADQGIGRKRAVLLHGPYGTGKTLGGYLTGRVAVESGWTFIYARPGRDDLQAVLQTARLYQPACVFVEDLDGVSDPADASAASVARLLDLFDGISTKDSELLVVLTTNHPERIHKGMLRPGRLDAVVPIAELDEDGFRRLYVGSIPSSALPDASVIDWAAVWEASRGFLPAYVKEAAERAYRYALARTGRPEAVELTTADLVAAADGLRPQLDLMDGAAEHGRPEELASLLSGISERAAARVLSEAVREGWDADALERIGSDGVKSAT